MASKTAKQSGKPEVITDPRAGMPLDSIVDVQHEEVQVLPLASRANQEVAKFNVARSWIAERKKKYSKLKISGEHDKSGQAAVKAAWQEIRNQRIAVGKKHAEIKKNYLEISRVIDGEKNELTRLLEEIEEPLKMELDRVEREKEEARQAEETRLEKILQARVECLLTNGMTFNGSFYVIGNNVSMDVVTLKTLSDDDYTKLVSTVQGIKAEIDAAAAEVARKEQEARDQVERQRKENEAKEAELLEKQQAFEKQQADHNRRVKEQEEAIAAEQKKAIEQRTRNRGKSLEAMGMSYNYSDFVWQFSLIDSGNIVLPVGTVEGLGDEHWNEQYNDISVKIAAMKEKQAAKDKEREAAEEARRIREILIEGRTTNLKYLGFVFNKNSDLYERVSRFGAPTVSVCLERVVTEEESDWLIDLDSLEIEVGRVQALEKDILEALRIEKENERLSLLSDAEQVKEYVLWFRNNGPMTGKPNIQNENIQKAFGRYLQNIVSAESLLLSELENL